MRLPLASGRIPSILPILDAGIAPAPLEELVAALAAGGAEWLQLRDKSADERSLYDRATVLRGVAEAHGLYLMVNDRVAIAAALGLGVHVGQRDLPPEAARELIGAHILGLSVDDLAELSTVASSPVDYVAVGPVFATDTKADAGVPIGVAAVAAARAATSKPLVAIGGIEPGNAEAVTRAGADCVAASSSLLLADDPVAATSALRAAAEAGLGQAR